MTGEYSKALDEFALGRRIEWGFDGHQLHIAPHAFADANTLAYPDPDAGAETAAANGINSLARALGTSVSSAAMAAVLVVR